MPDNSPETIAYALNGQEKDESQELVLDPSTGELTVKKKSRVKSPDEISISSIAKEGFFG